MTGTSGEGVVPAPARQARVVEAASAPEPEVEGRELGRVGRLLVAASRVAGLVMSSSSPIGVLWFLAYGAVGAVLTILRLTGVAPSPAASALEAALAAVLAELTRDPLDPSPAAAPAGAPGGQGG